MRQVHGAVFPQQRQHLPAIAATPMQAAVAVPPDARAKIARLFFDLRQALDLTPDFVAAQLVTEPEVILALERGEFERLQDWSETSRVVLAYTALAGIDGQPALMAIRECLRRSAPPRPQRAQPRRQRPSHGPSAGLPVVRLLHAGAILAHGARRLPSDALKQVREKPERALYALSLPLAVVLLFLNSSVVRTVFSYVPQPAAEVVQDVKMFFQVTFAPVRDGLRWIEVDDPRERRGDKLPRRGQSD